KLFSARPLASARPPALANRIVRPTGSVVAASWTPRHTDARPGVDWRCDDERATSPGARLRAERPRLAQHGWRGAEPRAAARQERAARLLDVLLHQLPARARRAARARGAAPRRARRRRSALAQVRARGGPGRARGRRGPLRGAPPRAR